VTGGYPFDLVGDHAPPPEEVAPRILDMALRAAARGAEAERDPDTDPLFGARPWRPARSLKVLFAEADAVDPKRSTRSDGFIGNTAHAALGDATDHNPWLVHGGFGIVRAGDLTNDPDLRLAAAFERLRARAHAGKLPQVMVGGYAILNGRITAPDWSGWRVYRGTNPHVLHGHVSVSLTPAQFDSTAPWGIFVTPGKPSPAKPARPAGPGWTGPDLRGSGANLRGDEGNNGPRVAAWQKWLNAMYPAYSDLKVDGWWGPATSRVNREFGRRSGVREADGRNIGPRLAAAYHRAGLFRTRSAAQARVMGHITRGARR
jgi:hypothetical protein